MRPSIIRKSVPELRPPPHLADYDRERAGFSWDTVRAELCGPSARGINIAVAAIDRHVATSTRDRVAFRFVSRTDRRRDITYVGLAQQTNRLANVLRALGVGRKDRLFVLAGRVPELYVTVLGALKNGTVVCPLFSAFGPEPIRTRLALGEGKILVTTEALYRRKVAGIAGDLPKLERVLLVGENGERTNVPGTLDFATLMDGASDRLEIEPTDAEDHALLHFTSGTTGTPKGAIHVHDAAVTHFATGRYALDLHPDDIFWCTADPGWVTGTSYGIIAPLLHGVTSLVDEADFDAERWYGLLQDHAHHGLVHGADGDPHADEVGRRHRAQVSASRAAIRRQRRRAAQSRGGMVGRRGAGTADTRQLVADRDWRHHDREHARDGHQAGLDGQAAARCRCVRREEAR